MVTTSPNRPNDVLMMGSASVTAGWIASEAVHKHQALHNEGELGVLLRLMDSGLPRTILEIGTWAGGSAWAWSHIRSVSHIVTVDNAPQPLAHQRLESLPCSATQVLGDSTQPATLASVKQALNGMRPDIVIIDGAHDYVSARQDWHQYGTLAGRGGLVVFHDTQGYPGNETVQVPRLWAEIRASYRTTELVDLPGGPGGTGIVWL